MTELLGCLKFHADGRKELGDYQFRREVALEAFEPSLEHSSLISPQVWDQAHYEQQGAWRLLFFRNLERDGIELWTQPRKAFCRPSGAYLREVGAVEDDPDATATV